MIIHDEQREDREDQAILGSIDSADQRLEPTEGSGLKRRHKVLLWMSGGVVAAAVIGIILFVYFANSSVKGTVHVSAPTANQSREPRKELTLAGQYIRFKYSDDYISQNSRATVPGAIEEHVLLSSGFAGKQIAAIVSRPIEPDLAEYSAYKYRFVHPELYAEKPFTVSGSTASIMTKTDGTEETIFIARKGLIATISITLTSPPSQGSLDAEVQKLAKSFIWLQ